MNRLFADQAGTFYTQSTNQINRMHGSTMRILCWSFCISLLSMAAPSVADDNTNDDWLSAPLVQLVREATMQYRDVEVAEGDGYVGDPCREGCTRCCWWRPGIGVRRHLRASSHRRDG